MEINRANLRALFTGYNTVFQQAFDGGQFPVPTDQSRLDTPASTMPFAHRGGRDNGGSSRDDGGRGRRRSRHLVPAPVSPADLGQQRVHQLGRRLRQFG